MDFFSVTDVYILENKFLFLTNVTLKKKRKKPDCDISQGESHFTFWQQLRYIFFLAILACLEMEEAENTQPKDESDGTRGVTVEASGQDSEDTSDTEVHYLTGLKVDFLIFHRIFVTICESNLIMACWNL